MTQQNNQSNLFGLGEFQLAGEGVQLTYLTSDRDGKPHFTYKDAEYDRSYIGNEIRIKQSDLGALVTVPLRVIPEVGSDTVTLIVPHFRVADLSGPVETLAINAKSRDLFGNDQMRFIRTAKMGIHALSQLLSRKQPVWFHHGALAMDPLGHNQVEPGTFAGQEARQDAHALALSFHLGVMLADPSAHELADMPGGIIPNEQPGRLSLGLHLVTPPLQKLRGDVADWAPRHKTQRHPIADRLLCWSALPQNAISGQRFGVGVSLFPGLLHQTHGMVFVLPGVQARQSKATPPHLVLIANGPMRLMTGPGDQPVARVFFADTAGRGLVIQCLARFQLVFSRLSARRTLSLETSWEMIPCSKLTRAASSRVQVPRSWPKSRGLRCSRSLRRSAPSCVKAVRSRWGREEPSCNTASPAALKPWITLRTVWSSQPSWRAITGARSPRAEASKIWQRRNTKASDERNPAWTWCRSSWVNGRIKIGVFIPPSVPHFLPPLVEMH